MRGEKGEWSRKEDEPDVDITFRLKIANTNLESDSRLMPRI
jgi:hypothetical protein